MIAAIAAFATAPLLGSGPHHSCTPQTRRTPRHLHERRKAAGQASAGEGKILYYQDPMHPWYRSDKPGIAPDCGMKLVPVYASDASGCGACHRAACRSARRASK